MRYTMRNLLATLAATMALAATTTAAPIVGGQVYAIGNSVTVDIISASAAYLSDVGLYSPFAVTIGDNSTAVGASVPIGGLAIGDELVFGIYVTNTGDTFLMGPGSRNADLIEHAAVNWITPTLAEISFEDIYGGGDFDYNDVVIRVEGVGPGRGGNVPEPSTIAIWGVLAGGGIMIRRFRRR